MYSEKCIDEEKRFHRLQDLPESHQENVLPNLRKQTKN